MIEPQTVVRILLRELEKAAWQIGAICFAIGVTLGVIVLLVLLWMVQE